MFFVLIYIFFLVIFFIHEKFIFLCKFLFLLQKKKRHQNKRKIKEKKRKNKQKEMQNANEIPNDFLQSLPERKRERYLQALDIVSRIDTTRMLTNEQWRQARAAAAEKEGNINKRLLVPKEAKNGERVGFNKYVTPNMQLHLLRNKNFAQTLGLTNKEIQAWKIVLNAKRQARRNKESKRATVGFARASGIILRRMSSIYRQFLANNGIVDKQQSAKLWKQISVIAMRKLTTYKQKNNENYTTMDEHVIENLWNPTNNELLAILSTVSQQQQQE